MNSSEAALLEQRRKAGMCIQCGSVKTHKIYLAGIRRKLVRESGLFGFVYSMRKFSLEEARVGSRGSDGFLIAAPLFCTCWWHRILHVSLVEGAAPPEPPPSERWSSHISHI